MRTIHKYLITIVGVVALIIIAILVPVYRISAVVACEEPKQFRRSILGGSTKSSIQDELKAKQSKDTSLLNCISSEQTYRLYIL